MFGAVALLVAMIAFPDVTITTETRHAHARGPDAAITTTIYIKGRDQRRESTFRVPSGERGPDLITSFTQCEDRRSVILNEAQRTYAFVPVRDWRVPPPGARPTQVAENGPLVEITIDAADTGERRVVGPFTARHVVTTTTTTPGAGAATRASVRIQDGWYIDLPAGDCGVSGESTDAYALAFIGPGRGNAVPDRMKVIRKGSARRGYAIEQTDRVVGDRDVASTTRLTAISERPIDDALFRVPSGYRPALPLPQGGFDLSRPDTWSNRARAYWQMVTGWVTQMTHAW
jgi:hypothetical protein